MKFTGLRNVIFLAVGSLFYRRASQAIRRVMKVNRASTWKPLVAPPARSPLAVTVWRAARMVFFIPLFCILKPRQALAVFRLGCHSGRHRASIPNN